MSLKATNRTKRIGVRVNEPAFERLQERADAEAKTVSEWCSDRLSEIARGNPSAFQQALIAEVSATRAITINLLFTLATNGKLTRDGVQQVVDAAHAAKYKEAGELLKQALARTQPRRVEPAGTGNSQAGGKR